MSKEIAAKKNFAQKVLTKATLDKLRQLYINPAELVQYSSDKKGYVIGFALIKLTKTRLDVLVVSNEKNRIPSSSAKSKFRSAFGNARFFTTKDAIAIDMNGDTRNGGHRCTCLRDCNLYNKFAWFTIYQTVEEVRLSDNVKPKSVLHNVNAARSLGKKAKTNSRIIGLSRELGLLYPEMGPYGQSEKPDITQIAERIHMYQDEFDSFDENWMIESKGAGGQYRNAHLMVCVHFLYMIDQDAAHKYMSLFFATEIDDEYCYVHHFANRVLNPTKDEHPVNYGGSAKNAMDETMRNIFYFWCDYSLGIPKEEDYRTIDANYAIKEMRKQL